MVNLLKLISSDLSFWAEIIAAEYCGIMTYHKGHKIGNFIGMPQENFAVGSQKFSIS